MYQVKQRVSRNLNRISGSVRKPEHIFSAYNKVIKTEIKLLKTKNQEATTADISELLGMPVEDIDKSLSFFRVMEQSLDDGIRRLEKGNGNGLNSMPSPEELIISKSLCKQTRKALATLTPREEKVLRMRYGIREKSDYTLEEVGQVFFVTPERIRQIEAGALKKLRHPNKSKYLAQFFE